MLLGIVLALCQVNSFLPSFLFSTIRASLGSRTIHQIEPCWYNAHALTPSIAATEFR